MFKLLTRVAFGLVLLAPSAGLAGERTVTLAVQNMDCASCPFIVKRSLEAVPGVTHAVVSFEDKTAVVSYDDTKTYVKSLTSVTTNAGYPSIPKS